MLNRISSCGLDTSSWAVVTSCSSPLHTPHLQWTSHSHLVCVTDHRDRGF